MGRILSSPKSMKLPVVEEEPPEVVTEAIKGEGARPKRRKGRAETIITGELEPMGKGKTLFG